MHKWKQKYIKPFQLLIVVFTLCAPIAFVQYTAAAPTYVSPNYGVDEVFMGAGGLNDASSASYRARASLGDTGVGNSASTNYQSWGGFTTNADPFIEMYVPSSSVNLGLLTVDNPAVTTATFTMRTYLASGYAVVSNSEPPKNGSYNMINLTSQAASSPGTEQFGINLAANNIAGIGAFGAVPSQLPDSSYSFGYATDTYNDSNLFKYVPGDVIARSDSSTGTTEYTISYLYNISSITPGGQFVFIHDIVATSYF